jgi:hypothetical protein
VWEASMQRERERGEKEGTEERQRERKRKRKSDRQTDRQTEKKERERKARERERASLQSGHKTIERIVFLDPISKSSISCQCLCRSKRVPILRILFDRSITT